MRRAIDAVYTAAAYVAGAFMVGTLLAILAGIFGRLLHVDVPGVGPYAGYCMAASAFLALAPTLRRGEHIRVTLLLSKLAVRPRRALEVACRAVAVLLSGALAWYSIRLVWQSHTFNDISQGMDATPLWIPQIAMALGTVLFCIAFVDDFAVYLRGGDPALRHAGSGELARTE